MKNNWQCPSCKSNAISVTDSYLVCHNCGNKEYLYDYANAYDNPMPREPELDIVELEDRIENLEAISAQPGRIPRQYHDEFQQIRGEVANLRNKVVAMTTKPKQAAQDTRLVPQPQKAKQKIGVKID